MGSEKKFLVSKKKYSKETSVVSVRLPIDLIDKIDFICKRTNRTRNEFLLLALEFAIENIVVDEE